MTDVSPYYMAEESLKHVEDMAKAVAEYPTLFEASVLQRLTVEQKLAALNYLRTVRTTIELMEMHIYELPTQP